MKRLELVVVEMEEARRLLATGEVPRLRLALILVDSAVELILQRLAESTLSYERFDFNALNRMDAAVARGDGSARLAAEIARLRPQVTSKAKRKRIEREFNVRLDFLVDKDKLPAALHPVLKKLHEYRNATYHRDEHRVAVLRATALVYLDAACTVLEHYDDGPAVSDGSLPPGLARFTDEVTGLRDPHCLPALVAGTFRSEAGLNIATVGAFLSEHLLGRLEDLESDIAYVEENLSGSDVRPGDGYLIVQIKDGDAEAIFNADVLRRRGYPLSAANMRSWMERAAAVANAATRDEMFTRFASIEDEFKDLEREARIAVHEIDEQANMF